MKVIITRTPREGRYKRGDIGYINGYVMNADATTDAVVVLGSVIVSVPICDLKVLY